MSTPLCVFATIHPKAVHLAETRAAIADIIAVTREEAGCLYFALHDEVDDESGGGRLFLYEKWTDRAALEAHHAKPYTQAIMACYDEWLAEPLMIQFLNPLD